MMAIMGGEATLNSIGERRIGRRNLVLSLLLIAATIVAYLPALGAEFIWDDDEYVTANPALKQLPDLEGLKAIWTPRVTPQYYPVVFTTFWIEERLYPADEAMEGGLAAWGYHLVNVLLHVANALLLVALARRIGLPPGFAWSVAFIFALHPVHVESVAWVTERKNVLSTLFYFLAAIAYLRFDRVRFECAGVTAESKPEAPWGWYGLAFLLFALALLSKSVTASLPVAIVLFLLAGRKRLTFVRLVPLLPMLIAGAVAGLHTGYLERAHVGAIGPDWDQSILERVLIASRALLFYPWKVIVPVDLLFVYPRWHVSAGDIAQWGWVAASLATGIGLALLWRVRGVRWPFLAFAFYAVTIFPALGFAPVYPHRFSFVADHFQYLASLGVIGLLVGGVGAAIRSPRSRTAAMTIVSFLLAALTFRQATIYSDARTLYTATVEANPQAWMARANLAKVLLETAQQAQRSGDAAAVRAAARDAEDQAREATAIRPDQDEAHANLSEALRLQERFPEALEAMSRAIAAVESERDDQRARGNESKALRAEQFRAAYLALMARLHEHMGDRAQAARHYADAVAINDDLMTAHEALARFAAEAGRIEEAAAHYARVVERIPHHYPGLLILAEQARREREYASARQLLERAFAAAGSPQEGHNAAYLLAWLLATADDPGVRAGASALAVADQMIRIDAGVGPYSLDLRGAALAELGRFDEAKAAAESARELAISAGLDSLASSIERRIAAYADGRSWRE